MNIAYFGRYSENAVNGVDVTGYFVAKEIVKLGHHVFCYAIGEVNEYFEDNGIKIRVFKNGGKFSLPTELKDYIKENKDKIEIFHLRSVFVYKNYLLSSFLIKNDIPYVITPHGGYNINIFNRNKIKKKIYFSLFERHYLNNANGVISCSGVNEIEDFLRLGYKGFKKTIYDPIYSDKTFTPKNNKKLIFLGRYDMEHKGLDHLLRMFKEIENEDSEYSLDLFGNGPDKNALQNLAVELKLKNVTINDPIYEKDKDKVLDSCNACIQVSRWKHLVDQLWKQLVKGFR
jgi:glycosyltransferase involved in cell wall biosynthesis